MPGKNQRDVILEFMRSNKSQPMTKSELARHLEVPSKDRAALRKTMETLEREGILEKGKKARYSLRTQSGNQLSGTLKFHPKGQDRKSVG